MSTTSRLILGYDVVAVSSWKIGMHFTCVWARSSRDRSEGFDILLIPLILSPFHLLLFTATSVVGFLLLLAFRDTITDF